VHRVWVYAAQGAGTRRMLNYMSFAVSSLWGLLRCKRPDFVFVESPSLLLAIPGFLASRYWRACMIFNVADLWPDSVRELGLLKDGPALKLAGLLERWAYRVSHKVTAVTEGIRSRLIQEKRLPPEKVLFLPNGVDPCNFNIGDPDTELEQSLGLSGRKVVLFAGTVGYGQAIGGVLSAAKILKERQDIAFVFIGDGSDKPRCVAEVHRLGLNNVRFLDAAPPEYVARLYSFSRAALATLKNIPLFEGARPSKILPAMACGVPVIYSGSGEGARLIDRSGAGIVVPPENPQALAQAVLKLCDDRDLAKRLGLNGRQFVEQNLSWQRLVEDWLQELASSN